MSLSDWCKKNGYDGVTKECIVSAFQSKDPVVQKHAKKERIKQMIEGRYGKEKERR